MVKTDIYSISGEKAGVGNLPDIFFGAKVNKTLMAQAVRVYLSNQRSSGAKTKTRSEVTGSGRKIWRQKGTGRARHGDQYAPIFVGGGVAHGPTGRENYRLRMPAKMKRAALFSALSYQFKSKKIIVIKNLGEIEPKTKDLNQVFKNLKIKTEKTLLILPTMITKIIRNGRNIEGLNIISAGTLSTYRILAARKIIIMEEALGQMKQIFNPKDEEK